MRNIVISSAMVLGAFFGFGPSGAFGIAIYDQGGGATDAEHIALAALPEFQAGGWFSPTNSGTDRSSVTLVSPDWVVTASHNLLTPDGLSLLPLSGMRVGFGANALTDSTKYTVTQIIRVPGFSTETYANDLAFLRLATPVTGIAPVSLYTGTLSTGQEVTAIGHGQPGSPAAGLLPYDGIERGMVNQIGSREEFLAYFPEASPQMVMTQFVPDNEFGNYEYFGGSVSRGDDGGGLFVLDDGVWKLAGVTSFDFDSPNYYAYSVYTAISPYYSWIASQPALASVVATVPEPGAFSFVVTGALALLARRTRTRTKKSLAAVKFSTASRS